MPASAVGRRLRGDVERVVDMLRFPAALGCEVIRGFHTGARVCAAARL
jgi:hypothetical protein